MSKFLHAIILEELQEFTYMRFEVKNKKLKKDVVKYFQAVLAGYSILVVEDCSTSRG